MNCKICKSTIQQDLVLKNARKFYLCEHCDFVFLADEFLLSKEQEKARYDQHQNLESNQIYMKILEGFYSYAVKAHYSSGDLLDFGSGPKPVFAELLQDKGIEPDIYDVFYAPNLPQRQYDFVASIETFEHFNQPLNEIKMISELLKKRAYLAVMTEFRPSLEVFKAWRYKDDTTHVSFYSPKTFEYISELFGFKLIKHNDKGTIILQKL